MSRISPLADVMLWIAAHDGRVEEQWKRQEQVDERTARKIEDFAHRLNGLERKIMWITGVASGFGALLGAILPGLL